MSDDELVIAVEGCAHGELDNIYQGLAELEAQQGTRAELLIICGDFQAVRNEHDLACMACPDKYLSMNSFYKYYSGECVAPVPTLVIGGNHEASNHMHELFYGGWLAPNIYYLGSAGCVRVRGLRIAGLSGIYKSNDYYRPHHERPPYTPSSMRSAYHVREVDVFRLLQLRSPVDICMSHDWPRNVALHGDTPALLRKKPFLEREIADASLGSPPAELLLRVLQPLCWFSAHLHVRYPAAVSHASGRTTSFLALDKCLPRRRFLELIRLSRRDVPHLLPGPARISLDSEWLAVLKSTHPLLAGGARVPLLARWGPVVDAAHAQGAHAYTPAAPAHAQPAAHADEHEIPLDADDDDGSGSVADGAGGRADTRGGGGDVGAGAAQHPGAFPSPVPLPPPPGFAPFQPGAPLPAPGTPLEVYRPFAATPEAERWVCARLAQAAAERARPAAHAALGAPSDAEYLFAPPAFQLTAPPYLPPHGHGGGDARRGGRGRGRGGGGRGGGGGGRRASQPHVAGNPQTDWLLRVLELPHVLTVPFGSSGHAAAPLDPRGGAWPAAAAAAGVAGAQACPPSLLANQHLPAGYGQAHGHAPASAAGPAGVRQHGQGPAAPALSAAASTAPLAAQQKRVRPQLQLPPPRQGVAKPTPDLAAAAAVAPSMDDNEIDLDACASGVDGNTAPVAAKAVAPASDDNEIDLDACALDVEGHAAAAIGAKAVVDLDSPSAPHGHHGPLADPCELSLDDEEDDESGEGAAGCRGCASHGAPAGVPGDPFELTLDSDREEGDSGEPTQEDAAYRPTWRGEPRRRVDLDLDSQG